MRIAVEGCCHGALDEIYGTLEYMALERGIKVDLLLICGDFQANRNMSDLACMACPDKYKKIQSFYKYYNGECRAPVLTIFIGGNHEASNYLQELYYGGWVAPNIYYLGNAGVVNFGGFRIGGWSGIYNHKHFECPTFEKPPYTQGSMRSVYHVRALQALQLRLLQVQALSGSKENESKPADANLDIFLSHDWPRGIWRYGNTRKLLQQKRFLQREIEANTLGSPVCEELLYLLKPKYWFSAHMHVKFPAIVSHHVGHPGEAQTCKSKIKKGYIGEDVKTTLSAGTIRDNQAHAHISTDNVREEERKRKMRESEDDGGAKISNFGVGDAKTRFTKFLALDKCLPRRDFLQVVEVEIQDQAHNGKEPFELSYDEVWLAILIATHNSEGPNVAPPYPEPTPSDIREALEMVRKEFQDNYRIPGGRTPEEFVRTVEGYSSEFNNNRKQFFRRPPQMGNPQTDFLLKRLGMNHTGITIPYVEERSMTIADMDIHLKTYSGNPESNIPSSNTDNSIVPCQKRPEIPAEVVDDNEIDLDDL